MKDARTLAYINLFAVLGAIPYLCELDREAAELIQGEAVSVGFAVKGGPEATLFFGGGKCRMVPGVERCEIKLPFSSCEKFNGLIDGTVTPIPSKGFTKIQFLLKKFTKLTDRLSAYLRPAPEALDDPEFFRNQPPIKGAREFVQKLSQMTEVFITTAVWPEYMTLRFQRILEEFPEIPQDHILIGSRKDKIDVDILFDDGMHNVVNSNAAYPILMRRP